MDKPLTLDQLAAVVYLSKEHLRTLFNKELGISPIKFAREARLHRAHELLLITTKPIKEIAAMIGFEDQHHFTRAFHQAFGISPMESRRRSRLYFNESLHFAYDAHQLIK